MYRPIFSTVLIVLSIAVFFVLIDPTYEEIKGLKEESLQFDEALVRSRELQEIRDELLSRYNTFSSEDLNRVQKLLPDNVDNVRLILDLDGIASEYGILIRDVSITEDRNKEENGAAVVDVGNVLGNIELSFSVTTSYDDFKEFMKDIERSLRIVDVKELSISSSGQSRDILNFDVAIKTYWLK